MICASCGSAADEGVPHDASNCDAAPVTNPAQLSSCCCQHRMNPVALREARRRRGLTGLPGVIKMLTDLTRT